jgi:Domain of unknown function DUF11
VKPSTRSFGRTTPRLVAVCVLSLAALSGAVSQLSAAGASAPASANLSVAQSVSNGAAKNQTIITEHVHNAGPSTATNVETVALVKTNSHGLTYFVSSGSCAVEPAPPSWTDSFTCVEPSIRSGSTWEPKITITGTQGATLTQFLSVGAHSPADPSLANNSSTLNTYVGSEADLGLSQAVTAGKTAGNVTVTATVRNHGPWTANALQYVGEIKSAGFSSVHASGPGGSSCQFIPAAAGYNKAIACTFAAVAPGKPWVTKLAFTGKAKSGLVLKGSISANNPADPARANNTASTSTRYKA